MLPDGERSKMALKLYPDGIVTEENVMLVARFFEKCAEACKHQDKEEYC